ncbi:MAG: hypothetical protein K0U37_04190 [Gammaproteobacteria bacterium]|nr:hypothetical protein [Gammaproteobacteria bacterium]
MKVRQALSVIAIASLSLLSIEVQAKSSQAMVSVRAISTPKLHLIKGEPGYATYDVCNNSKRILTGIEPKSIPGVRFSKSRFDLKPQQCRMVGLAVNPSLIPQEGLHGGPVFQIAKSKKSFISKPELENGFWAYQPTGREALSVSDTSNYEAPVSLSLAYTRTTSSSERDLHNAAQSRYPGPIIVCNLYELPVTNLHYSTTSAYAIRETNCTDSLEPFASCLLVIDWVDDISEENPGGTLEITGETYSTVPIIAYGSASLRGVTNPNIITSTPSDLSNLHLVYGTPLVITVKGTPTPTFVVSASTVFWGLLSQTTSCTGSGVDSECTITLETDATGTVPASECFIQNLQADGSNALVGTLTVN